ncbi:(Fe-S)-binding protein [Kocuria palustris]|uniref:(Fe-S)-binding protein n=1 Tax=Kocuria palustris TaxID=71999 RepID=UPI0006AA28B3|nr:(Fe-S)-binding protein [Kocuria palustris]ALB02418.1 Fe-S oxidoreductase [Kocuria palustris]MCT1835166.1 (Fe-S)-binding protein [Kocuria palustris]
MRIALFATCIVDAMYPKVALATVRVLERLGHEVIFPPGQGCCSQMHVNSGYIDGALPVVRNHVEAFTAADYDVAVAPSGSCVASLGHQQPMIARECGDEALAQRAEEVAGRTYELSELLTDVLGVTDAGAQLGSWFPHRITYHPSCHGLRLLGLGDRPTRLLSSVQDLELVELPDAYECCGFGGTFSFKNPDVSGAMAEAKLRSIERTDTELCAGGDASCLLHLSGAAHRRRTPVRTVHLAEILASTRQNPLELDDIAELSIPQGTASIGPRAEAPAVETAEGAAR